jgi:hypothetical protein
MPKHQLNNAPISKTRNAASVTAVADNGTGAPLVRLPVESQSQRRQL